MGYPPRKTHKTQFRWQVSKDNAFVAEEPGFAVEAGGVAGEAAVGADDAMAGDDEGDGIMAYGAADRLRGHPAGSRFAGSGKRKAPVGRCQPVGYPAIAHCRPEWYFEQDLPDGLAERGSLQKQQRCESRRMPAEIAVEPAHRVFEDRKQAGHTVQAKLTRTGRGTVKAEAEERFPVARHRHAAQRRLIVPDCQHRLGAFHATGLEDD